MTFIRVSFICVSLSVANNQCQCQWISFPLLIFTVIENIFLDSLLFSFQLHKVFQYSEIALKENFNYSYIWRPRYPKFNLYC